MFFSSPNAIVSSICLFRARRRIDTRLIIMGIHLKWIVLDSDLRHRLNKLPLYSTCRSGAQTDKTKITQYMQIWGTDWPNYHYKAYADLGHTLTKLILQGICKCRMQTDQIPYTQHTHKFRMLIKEITFSQYTKHRTGTLWWITNDTKHWWRFFYCIQFLNLVTICILAHLECFYCSVQT